MWRNGEETGAKKASVGISLEHVLIAKKASVGISLEHVLIAPALPLRRVK